MPLQAVASPKPFDASEGYRIDVSGGVPPYTYIPRPAPPNPPGVEVTPGDDGADVDVPDETASGTVVVVFVQDSSTPPNQVPVGNTVR